MVTECELVTKAHLQHLGWVISLILCFSQLFYLFAYSGLALHAVFLFPESHPVTCYLNVKEKHQEHILLSRKQGTLLEGLEGLSMKPSVAFLMFLPSHPNKTLKLAQNINPGTEIH